MKKYRVVGILSASVTLGTYEADSKEKAILMAEDDGQANWNPSLCHYCSKSGIELGDIYELDADEIDND